MVEDTQRVTQAPDTARRAGVTATLDAADAACNAVSITIVICCYCTPDL